MDGEMRQDEPLGSWESCSTNTAVEPLSLLASVALAPLCGKGTNYSCTCDLCFCLDPLEESVADPNLQSEKLQLHLFIKKADDILKKLLEVVSDREVYAATVASFLSACKPYFNHLESTARSPLNENNPLSESTRSQLFDFSQTLCNKLENLVLTCAGNNLLSLDETEPHNISHFYIGQCGCGPFKVTIFWYCQPTPYLSQVNTGLYKRMRWNVDQLGELETNNTEYYFLCCEDVDPLPGGDTQSISHGRNVVRMWSIGQWVQVSPETDDINDWILCKTPQGTYLKRVILGSEEPSCYIATDFLLQLLMLDQRGN